MKTVFTSDELVHIWAHQSAPAGRCPGNMSFNGVSLRSYSTEIARIITHKGRKAYLLNDTGYSVTTSKHQSMIRRAIPGDATVFSVSGIGRGGSLPDGKQLGLAVYNYAIERAANALAKAEKARTFKDMYLSDHARWIEKAKEASKFFGLRRKVDERAVERHAEAVKRERARRAKAEKQREIDLEKKLQERMQQWINGDLVTFPWSINKVCLRARTVIINDTDESGVHRGPSKVMETSRGVTVPIEEAERAFRFAIARREKGWRRNGEEFKVGSYQLDSVSEAGIVAGCHTLKWDEVERFAKEQGWM